MSELNLEKLIKLLKLSASSNDNEALLAIRKANELLATADWDWDKLLRGKVTIIADPFGPSTAVEVPKSNWKPQPAYQPPPSYSPPPRPAYQPPPQPYQAPPRRTKPPKGKKTQLSLSELLAAIDKL